MKIVSVVHFYPPYRNAGSERMLHTMNLALVQAGHDVEVIVTSMPEAGNDPFELDGIRVTPGRPLYAGTLGPDILISHHENARTVVGMSRVMGCKSVILLHNDFPQSRNLLRMSPSLTVFNTEWLRAKLSYLIKEKNTMVFHPPVWAHEHCVAFPGEKITLINLNKDKGSEFFYEIAKWMPEHSFLGVVGAHGEQYVPEGLPFNVEIMPHQKDMRAVWHNTGILLVPSVYESYGMVGPEAMASGIPVIATSTPGLRESLGAAGLFVKQRRNIVEWQDAILKVIAEYDVWSERALIRSLELDPSIELERWVNEIEALGHDHGSSVS